MQDALDTISYVGGLIFGLVFLFAILILFLVWLVAKRVDKMSSGLDARNEAHQMGLISTNQYREMRQDDDY